MANSHTALPFRKALLLYGYKIRAFELKKQINASSIVLFILIINKIAMKTDVLQRVKSILENTSLSESQFAKTIGVNQKTLNQQLRGDRSLSIDIAIGILSSFEDVSAEWLMRGEGEMFKASSQKIGNISHSSGVVNNGNGNSIANNDVSKMIELQQEYISMLKKKDEQIDRLTIVIEKMTNRL